ncbi:MAG: anhydro-N-acetylmuramic acid kinase [Parvibaculales bacterium]
MEKKFVALGLMSGTSMDGIDVALLETDGKNRVVFGPHQTFAYAEEARAILSKAMTAATTWRRDDAMPAPVKQAEQLITRTHLQAVAGFVLSHGLDVNAIDVIGFHGQTILHEPELGRTVQIGDGQALADSLGCQVVDQFRLADVAAGGQGAPLAPLYHTAIAHQAGADLPLAVLNLGGVGNITFIGGDGTVLGFDTGPGNALMDDWMAARTAQAFDEGGKLAATGAVDPDVLRVLLDHPYFLKAPPKSLDRNAFSLAPCADLSVADGAATLAAFTALSVACAMPYLPEPPRKWVVCGGGRHNSTVIEALGEALGAEVVGAEAALWPGDELEAQAFAWLAVRNLLGLPLSLPETTGCSTPTTGGVLRRPA